MQLTLAAIIGSAAVFVVAAPQPRQFCDEAARFGGFSLSPTTVAGGDTLTVNSSFECAVDYFGIIPEYTDYYIEAVTDSGHEPPILLARRTLAPGCTSDTFTVQVPDAYYTANATHVVTLETTFPVIGTKGIPYSVVGSIEAGITIIECQS